MSEGGSFPIARQSFEEHASREFLLGAAAWQDSLLQSYRGIFLNLQSILLAIGIGLLIASLGIDSAVAVTTILVTLALMGTGSLILLLSMKRIVMSRGRDVDFWHKELLLAENSLAPEHRHFTQFKLFQKLQRHDSHYIRKLVEARAPVDDEQADEIIGKGLGHTRRVIDRDLFSAAGSIWVVLVAYSLLRMFAL